MARGCQTRVQSTSKSTCERAESPLGTQALLYPKLAAVGRDFIPNVDAAFYLHNFKGTRPGALVREYPGPWRVLRRGGPRGTEVTLVHEQAERPALRNVQLEILARS